MKILDKENLKPKLSSTFFSQAESKPIKNKFCTYKKRSIYIKKDLLHGIPSLTCFEYAECGTVYFGIDFSKKNRQVVSRQKREYCVKILILISVLCNSIL